MENSTKRKMTKCNICGTKESKGWLGKGSGIYCNDCSKDINDFEFQPKKNFNTEILAEVFFRRGKGDKITYKELHNKKSDLRFIEFMDLWKLNEKKLEDGK